MIQSVYIKNFKAWRKGVFKPFGGHTIFVGQNNAGKTSILEALDYFFNHTKMDEAAMIDPQRDVEIGVRVNGQNFKRIFDCHTHEAKLEVSDCDWSLVDSIRYIYVPSSGKSPSRIAGELVAAKTLESISGQTIDTIKRASLVAAESVIGDRTGLKSSVRIRILPAKAVDVDLGSMTAVFDEMSGESADDADEADRLYSGRGTKSKELLHGWDELLSIATSHDFKNVILGIDDAESTVLLNGCEDDVLNIENRFAQLLMSTGSKKLVTRDNGTILYAVGNTPDAKVAATIGSSVDPGTVFLFVEGQYDLPWYRKALELLGKSQKYSILPGGGSNVDVLLNEFRKLNLNCMLIRDGDTSFKSNPERDDYSLRLECVEMYSPRNLLLDCFGIAPEPIKEIFFKNITRNVHGFAPSIRGSKSRFDNDDIKEIIADRIDEYMTEDSDFVKEIGHLIADYENRHS